MGFLGHLVRPIPFLPLCVLTISCLLTARIGKTEGLRSKNDGATRTKDLGERRICGVGG